MKNNKLIRILKEIKNSDISIDEALNKLKMFPFEDIGYAKVDHHREIRNGSPEVIYCEGKTIEEIKGIIGKMMEMNSNILATRANKNIFNEVKKKFPEAKFHSRARIITIKNVDLDKSRSKILVVTAGTSDIPVAEEAFITADFMGNQVEKLYDVGVAGLHRLLGNTDKLTNANVIIVVAGMEGALPSVVGGLVDVPVIGVPTSIGYGANFKGLSALLAMLNSCASGMGVVNIDNGFGAAYLADSIINQIEKAREN